MHENIRKKAEEIREKYSIDTYPIEIEVLEDILVELGYKIKYFDSCDKSVVIGNLIIEGRKPSLEEQRESIAHELGHVVSHMTNQLNEKNLSITKEEAQANAFLMYFLIPDNLLKEEMIYCNNKYEIAEHFGITKDTMKKRLKYYKNDHKNEFN